VEMILETSKDLAIETAESNKSASYTKEIIYDVKHWGWGRVERFIILHGMKIQHFQIRRQLFRRALLFCPMKSNFAIQVPGHCAAEWRMYPK
jgi:hypothetical protein